MTKYETTFILEPGLVLTNAQMSQAGNYLVVVTNLSPPAVTSSNATLTVLADQDGDGMGDEWETSFGLDANLATDAFLDPVFGQEAQPLHADRVGEHFAAWSGFGDRLVDGGQ